VEVGYLRLVVRTVQGVEALTMAEPTLQVSGDYRRVGLTSGSRRAEEACVELCSSPERSGPGA
jgi:hypothetical protein